MKKLIFIFLIGLSLKDSQAQFSIQAISGFQQTYINRFDVVGKEFSPTVSLNINYGIDNLNWLLSIGYRKINGNISNKYIFYDHRNTQRKSVFFNETIYEYGILNDIIVDYNNQFFDIHMSRKIIKGLYWGLGLGLTYKRAIFREGTSKSRFHYYNVDLSGLKFNPIVSPLLNTSIQYRLPLHKKFDMVVKAEYLYTFGINVPELKLKNIKQHTIIAEAGISYQLF